MARNGCAKCDHGREQHSIGGCRGMTDGKPCTCKGGFTASVARLTIAERLATLERADALVAVVADELNDCAEVCGCCGVRKYQSWHEAQAKQQLEGVRTRLQRARGRIMAPPTEADQKTDEQE